MIAKVSSVALANAVLFELPSALVIWQVPVYDLLSKSNIYIILPISLSNIQRMVSHLFSNSKEVKQIGFIVVDRRGIIYVNLPILGCVFVIKVEH